MIIKYVILFSAFLLHSCQLNCQDCNPVTTGSYNITNGASSNLTLIFYGSKNIEFKNEKVFLSANEQKPFLYFETGKPPSSILSSDYHEYDSVSIFNFNNQLIKTLKKDICRNDNVLCTSDYIKVSEFNLKNGTKNIKYELILK